MIVHKTEQNLKRTVVKIEHFTAVFLYPKERNEVSEMANRNRTNPVQFYLSDDEQYILNTKFKASGMKSMSAFLRKQILYGNVYDVDYSYLRNYNTELGRISSNLNQIAKRLNSTENIYQEDINEVKELMNEVWQSDQNGSTWKTQLRRDINFFIKSASTYEEFLLLMRAKGYEIKGKTFGEDAAKYISFRSLDKEHFVRGSARSLGKEYTKERIRERIEKKRERKAVIPKKDYSARRLIDTSDEKFQNSPGLQQWAAIENLKIAAQSYNEAGSLSDLEHKITVKNEAGRSARQSVVELEHRMKDLAEIIKYAEQYKDNRSYHIGYKKAKNPDAYFRRYESQIILYGGARRMLEQAGIKLKGLNVDKLRAEYQALETQKKELTATYKSCEKEVWDLKRKQENLNRYLGRTQTDPVQEQQTKTTAYKTIGDLCRRPIAP